MRWADNYRTGRLGGPQLIDTQLGTTTAAGPGGDRYAAGIAITPEGALTHTGGWAGFSTTFDVSADHRVAVAVSCNGVDDRSRSDIAAMIEELRATWATA